LPRSLLVSKCSYSLFFSDREHKGDHQREQSSNPPRDLALLTEVVNLPFSWPGMTQLRPDRITLLSVALEQVPASQTLKFVLKPTTCCCNCVAVFLAYGILLQLLFSGKSLFPLGITQYTRPKLSICG
jgi:hypothetical protein